MIIQHQHCPRTVSSISTVQEPSQLCMTVGNNDNTTDRHHVKESGITDSYLVQLATMRMRTGHFLEMNEARLRVLKVQGKEFSGIVMNILYHSAFGSCELLLEMIVTTSSGIVHNGLVKLEHTRYLFQVKTIVFLSTHQSLLCS